MVPDVKSAVMRLGKPMEHLQAALRATTGGGKPAEQLTTIGRQLGYFGYLTYDALVWVRSWIHGFTADSKYSTLTILPGEHRQSLQPEAQHGHKGREAREPVLALGYPVQPRLWALEGMRPRYRGQQKADASRWSQSGRLTSEIRELQHSGPWAEKGFDNDREAKLQSLTRYALIHSI